MLETLACIRVGKVRVFIYLYIYVYMQQMWD